MTNKHPWQDWQLTAYVLEELEPDLASRITSAQANDPQLACEIQSLRSTLEQVSLVLKQEPKDSLGGQRRSTVQAAIDIAKNSASLTHDVVVESIGSKQPSSPASGRRLMFMGLLATAACFLVAVMASAPIVSNWGISHGTPDATHTNLTKDKAVHEAGEVVTTANIDSMPVASASSASGAAIKPTTDETLVNGPGSNLVSIAPGDASAAPPATSLPGSESILELGELAGSEAKYIENPLPGAPNRELADRLASGIPRMGMGTGGMPGMDGGTGMGMGMGGGMPGMGGGMGLPGTEGGMGMEMGSGMGGMGGMGMEARSGGRPAVSTRSRAGGEGLSVATDEAALEQRRSWRFRRSDAERQTNDKYAPIQENRYIAVADQPLSTFSIDVDTASYSKVRQYLKEARTLPPADAVRIEELINYFDYQYVIDRQGRFDDPFIAKLAVARSPWNKERQLVRIALQAKKVDMSARPQANIVFLLDVSGSMADANKLPLVKESMRMMIEQLGENDRIAMVVYAGAAGCVLESTRGDQKPTILAALNRLNAGGSTNGGQGIQLAYDIARDHFIAGGINRVILCTDGDFNVGVTSTNALVEMVATNAKSKIFLTVLGYGTGNTNDAMMEQIADRGNGVYGFVDSRREAKRQMVKQLASNLMTVAKDVKIQVEFNPNRVREYRLIGYENRLLETADFDNDQKDAGEIGAGHRVTALYEIIPVDAPASGSPGDKLRYQPNRTVLAQPSGKDSASGQEESFSSELLAVNLRYQEPEGNTSKLLTFPLEDNDTAFQQADQDFRWAASVAQFGMLLRRSEQAQTTWEKLLSTATAAAGDDPDAARQECLEMIEIAGELFTKRPLR